MSEPKTDVPGRAVDKAPRWLVAAPWLFVALWSFGYTPTRVALNYCEPIFMLAVRYMGVLVVLIPAYFVVRPPLPQRRRDWMHLVIVGLLIQGAYFTLTNIAIKIGASAAGLVGSLVNSLSGVFSDPQALANFGEGAANLTLSIGGFVTLLVTSFGSELTKVDFGQLIENGALSFGERCFEEGWQMPLPMQNHPFNKPSPSI